MCADLRVSPRTHRSVYARACARRAGTGGAAAPPGLTWFPSCAGLSLVQWLSAPPPPAVRSVPVPRARGWDAGEATSAVSVVPAAARREEKSPLLPPAKGAAPLARALCTRGREFGPSSRRGVPSTVPAAGLCVLAGSRGSPSLPGQGLCGDRRTPGWSGAAARSRFPPPPPRHPTAAGHVNAASCWPLPAQGASWGLAAGGAEWTPGGTRAVAHRG